MIKINFSLLLGVGWWLLTARGVAAAVTFNEIYASPVSGEPEWFELYNDSDEAATLTGWQLAELTSGVIKNHELLVAGEASLGAREYLVLSPSKVSLNNSGDTLYLFDGSGAMVQELTYPKLPSAQSYTRGSDGQWRLSEQVSPGAANPEPSAATAVEGEGATNNSESGSSNSSPAAVSQGVTVQGATCDTGSSEVSEPTPEPSCVPPVEIDSRWLILPRYFLPANSQESSAEATPAATLDASASAQGEVLGSQTVVVAPSMSAATILGLTAIIVGWTLMIGARFGPIWLEGKEFFHATSKMVED